MSKWFRDMLFDQGTLSLTRVMTFIAFWTAIAIILVAVVAAFWFGKEWSQTVSIVTVLLSISVGGKLYSNGIDSIFNSERGRPPLKQPINQQNYPAQTDVESKPIYIKEGNQ